MKRETDFMENIERYHFDFGECSACNGYAQVDTSQDAPYFGIWTNPMNLNHSLIYGRRHLPKHRRKRGGIC